MIEIEAMPLAEGIVFGEGPRWHDGFLYFSDIPRDRVMTCSRQGELATVVELPRTDETAGYSGPSGLGLMPDGSLLITMMSDRRILRYDAGELKVHADLRAMVDGKLNDLVVDGEGRAYVGAVDAGKLILVRPDGSATIVAEDVPRANGTVITPDGSMLIIANGGQHLTAADIGEDGLLGRRRVWADLGVDGAVRRRIYAGDAQGPVMWSDLAAAVVFPDGIALDAEGAVWVGGAYASRFVRVIAGGHITHVVHTPGRLAIAPALGGEDRRTLYMLTTRVIGDLGHRGDLRSSTAEKLSRGEAESWIEVARVDVPGAGWP